MGLAEERIRAARIMHLALVATAPMYGVVGELADPAPGDYATFRLIFFVISVTAAMLGFQVRARMIPAALDTIRRQPHDADGWQRWTAAHITSWVAAEMVVLLGFVLRFVGGTLLESLPFYIIGMGLLLAWAPARPK